MRRTLIAVALLALPCAAMAEIHHPPCAPTLGPLPDDFAPCPVPYVEMVQIEPDPPFTRAWHCPANGLNIGTGPTACGSLGTAPAWEIPAAIDPYHTLADFLDAVMAPLERTNSCLAMDPLDGNCIAAHMPPVCSGLEQAFSLMEAHQMDAYASLVVHTASKRCREAVGVAPTDAGQAAYLTTQMGMRMKEAAAVLEASVR